MSQAESSRGKVGRNQPCPCGSGLKYKHCCADKDAADPDATSTNVIWIAIGLVVLAGGALTLHSVASDDGSEPKRVWSKEHGHWHIEGQEEIGAIGAPAAQPPGPAPAGKVWSAEHGHWHDEGQ